MKDWLPLFGKMNVSTTRLRESEREQMGWSGERASGHASA